jgi:hypothetical protein
MKIRTNTKAGGVSPNHNETAQNATAGLKFPGNVKAGEAGLKEKDSHMASRAKSLQRLVASLSILLCLVALVLPAFAGLGKGVRPSNASQLYGGNVMPPSARPFGFSLADMAGQIAQFATSFNNPAFYPTTPFQILYGDPNTITFSSVEGNGLLETGSNTFHVHAGTVFYVPIQSADDSPPIVGNFPSDSSTVLNYWFDESQLGWKGFIKVDGKTTSIGAAYLVGPITTQPLQDGAGTHIITLGVFLGPLNRSSHTVSFRSQFDGAAIPPGFFGLNFFEAEFTYKVIVD